MYTSNLQKRKNKALHVHFSIVSSEYQLCQLNDIHTRSPNQSALRALAALSGSKMKMPRSLDTQQSSSSSSSSSQQQQQQQHVSVESSWRYLYTTTQTAYDDPIRAFAAKSYKTAQELVPVLFNLRGVVDNREFFQRDNYRVLVAVRRSLVSDMESMYSQQPSLQSIHRHVAVIHNRKSTESTTTTKSASSSPDGRPKNGMVMDEKPLDVVLESAILSIGRCLDLVRPAGLLTGSVAREDFKRALTSLQQAYYLLDRACDPDEPLPPNEWGVMPRMRDSIRTGEAGDELSFSCDEPEEQDA